MSDHTGRIPSMSWGVFLGPAVCIGLLSCVGAPCLVRLWITRVENLIGLFFGTDFQIMSLRPNTQRMAKRKIILSRNFDPAPTTPQHEPRRIVPKKDLAIPGVGPDFNNAPRADWTRPFNVCRRNANDGFQNKNAVFPIKIIRKTCACIGLNRKSRRPPNRSTLRDRIKTSFRANNA